MNKLILNVLRDILEIAFILFLVAIPCLYFQSARKAKEKAQIEAAQENIQRLIWIEKRKELLNMTDKQIEELKAEEKAQKDILGQ